MNAAQDPAAESTPPIAPTTPASLLSGVIVQMNVCTLSRTGRIAEASIVYSALQREKQHALREMMVSHNLSDYQEAAECRSNYEYIEQMQQELFDQVVELASENHMRAQGLQHPKMSQHYADAPDTSLKVMEAQYREEFVDNVM